MGESSAVKGTLMKLKELFHATFTDDILNDLIECIQNAYAATALAHDPSVGHDAASFGFLNYKSRVHYLKQLHDDKRGILVARLHPFFSLQIGEFKLSSYNAGDSSETELAKCFPRNKGRAVKVTELNAKQLTLDLGLAEEDDSHCRHLILCDLGDAINGLRRLFIGVPVEAENGKMCSRWSQYFAIWESPALNFAPQGGPIAPVPVAPVELVQPPKLVLKPTQIIVPDTE
jgi:hypothetical protein